ncbi:MAG: 30S ribosomal protein S9 [Promethearchaeota archaeon]
MKVVLSSGKRKTAIARAVVRKGKGRIRINSKPLEIWDPQFYRQKIEEPLKFIPEEIRNSIDIKIRVHGGGIVGQTEAIRTAIARALVNWTDSEELRLALLHYDRSTLAGDPRRKERKKAGRKGARARRTKSYR